MADLTDTEIDTALERGRIAHLVEPRATAARYDRKSARIIVELNNGCTFAFPPHLAQGLEAATDDEPVSYTHLDVYKRQVEGFTIPPTRTCVSGNGAHLYYHVPPGERARANTTGMDGWAGLDVRGNG